MNYLKIKKILEDKGFDVTRDGGCWCVHQYTPAGEDWWITVHKLKDIADYAGIFDKEEEFTMWIEARKRDKSVPGPAPLWEDQLWKENILKEVAEEIECRK